MARERRAPDEIASAQLVERAQQMMLITQPACVFRDDGGVIAVGTDPERIAPFAAAADLDGPCRKADFMFVENPAHRPSPPDPRVVADWRVGAVQASRVTHRRQTMRERLAR
jgi:hypothetical protein